MKPFKDFSTLTSLGVQAALKAGALLSKGYGTNFQVSSKKGKQNLVTEYDTASQKLIITTIKKEFPQHQFLAEEEKFSKIPPPSKVLWVIDPLDGTVNFSRTIPIFSVSIAALMGKEIVSGIVYNPITCELFIAEKGKGSFLFDYKLKKSKRLQVSNRRLLDQSMMATGFPYDVNKNPLKCIDRFANMAKLGVPIRRLGSAAIDLAYVAAGRFDTFWEVGLHPWDMAAGKLLVEEAGGTVTHYDGKEHQIFGYLPLLATNGHLHTKMVNFLKKDMPK